ncbi:MAG: hypothetical protein JW750_11870 [Anaerolineaceae bacterium]|nr:hypothetical protein [Anaerolineaceae bacterium]
MIEISFAQPVSEQDKQNATRQRRSQMEQPKHKERPIQQYARQMAAPKANQPKNQIEQKMFKIASTPNME